LKRGGGVTLDKMRKGRENSSLTMLKREKKGGENFFSYVRGGGKKKTSLIGLRDGGEVNWGGEGGVVPREQTGQREKGKGTGLFLALTRQRGEEKEGYQDC